MKVTTAVIYASGFGTRMLPETAAVQKELLPILDRPVIDYLVADCLAAGVSNIIFVIQPNSHALQDYYVGNTSLESHLTREGKKTALADLEKIHNSATFNFVEQPVAGDRGTAVPLRLAIPHLPKNEAVIVCYGDQFIWHEDGQSEMKKMVDLFQKTGAAGAVIGMEREQSELHRYGVFDIEQRGEQVYLRGIVEKPPTGEEPSNIINSGVGYILTPQLLPFVQDLKIDERLGEYLLTDAVTAAARGRDIVVHKATGHYLDAGNLAGWLEANLVVARSNPDLAHLAVYKP